LRERLDQVLRMALESVVLAAVTVAPWLFGGVEPFEGALFVLTAVLLLLWAMRGFVVVGWPQPNCPLFLSLLGMVLLAGVQIIPLPSGVLSWFSPGTVRLQSRLLPAEPEDLPEGEPKEQSLWPAGSSISVAPWLTHRELLRLLALVVLFGAVRFNVAGAASLRRLSLVCVINGALLALFALLHFFSAAPNTLYWTFAADAPPFGPFVCRNHFPFYVNQCIGLGTGLLLGLWARPGARARGRDGSGGLEGFSGLLQDSRALWLAAALSLMVGSVAVSLSRGGGLALLGGVVVFVVLRLRGSRRLSWLGPLLAAGAAALALVAWLGFSKVEARMATVLQHDAWEERINMWRHVLGVVPGFPSLGTGYGTLGVVEPLERSSAEYAGVVFSHAHNDYLEALVEGGLARLLLTLLAIFLVYRLGYRALRTYAGGRTADLVLGALFAFTTIVLHSVADFGLHIPAVALLSVVIMAQVAALGQAAAARTATVPTGAPVWFAGLRLGAAGGAVILAAVLVQAGVTQSLAWNHRATALSLSALADAESRQEQLEKLQAAVRITPDSAQLQLDLGRMHLIFYNEGLELLERQYQAEAVTEALAVTASGEQSWSSVVRFEAATLLRLQTATVGEERLRREHLVPGLRSVLVARDLCPLLREAQELLADHADQMQKSEPRIAYLLRARRVSPDDARLWYLCGRELVADKPNLAAENWHRSLELSDRYLSDVLEQSTGHLSSEDLVARVLPERAEVLVRAAEELYPGRDVPAAGRPLLEKAVKLLDQKVGVPTAEQLRSKAILLTRLRQVDQAVTAYQAALTHEPRQTVWRVEYARLLVAQGRQDEARNELQTVLAVEPGQAEARALLEDLKRPR
jgi:O-antigen ligase